VLVKNVRMNPETAYESDAEALVPGNLQGLRELAAQWHVNLQGDEDVSILGRPVTVGGLTAPNSMAIHPMEGCDGDSLGRPGDLTVRRYDRFAAGGAGLIWVEAIAVVPEGRTNPRHLWLHPDSAESFRLLVARMRRIAAERFGAEHRPILVAQLTHGGRYSRPTLRPEPMIVQHDPYRDAKMNLPADRPVLADDYLDALPERYAEAAALAFDAGFDAVDIKACHGYLMSDLLAGHTRRGKYGGSFENRTRLLLAIIDGIRRRLGPDPSASSALRDLAAGGPAAEAGRMIVTRLGVFDAVPFPYGWGTSRDDFTAADLAEPKRLVGELVARSVPMINITAANPYYNPHYSRPYSKSRESGLPPEHPIIGVARLIALAGEIQKTFPQVVLVGTGYSWLRGLMPNVMAWAKRSGLTTMAGAGRMAIAYPDFPADVLARGRLDERKACLACGACTTIMRDGGMTGCVVRDGEVYGPIYRSGRGRNEKPPA